ncbi:MAG: S1C family serine protease [Candidatus Moraniibacteriota bacterium]
MFKKIKKLIKFFLFVVLFLIIGGFAGVVADRFVMPWLSGFESLQKYSFFQKANERVTIIERTKEVNVQEDYSVANTAERVLPSVVSIISFEEKEESSESFRRKIKSSKDIQDNIKTGLVLTGDGLIVSVMDNITKEIVNEKNTNNQESEKLPEEVEKKGYKYKVLVKNGKEYDARIKAIDPYSNLVFYKIEADNLVTPNLGNSQNLEMGEKTVVCGNANGEYQNTFFSGIIQERDKSFTLLNSELSSSEKMEGALMVNADISNKNIGGPVVDFNGDVVGIANEIEKDGKKAGFVVPIDQVKPIMDEVIQKGEIKRPFFGAYYLSINREIALLNDLPVNEGALVYSFSGQQGLAVIKNSPADKAGVKIGDIITKVEDTDVNLENSLAEIISSFKPGDELKLEVLRSGEKKEITVELE